jgi:hypothetical protein
MKENPAMTKQAEIKPSAGDAPGSVRVVWDQSKLESNYANVCNVTFTREELVLLFGVNQSWQRQNGELHVQLLNRLILSPFAAKRLSLLLNASLEQYESRFGALDPDVRGTRPNGETSVPLGSNGELAPGPSA